MLMLVLLVRRISTASTGDARPRLCDPSLRSSALVPMLSGSALRRVKSAAQALSLSGLLPACLRSAWPLLVLFQCPPHPACMAIPADL